MKDCSISQLAIGAIILSHRALPANAAPANLTGSYFGRHEQPGNSSIEHTHKLPPRFHHNESTALRHSGNNTRGRMLLDGWSCDDGYAGVDQCNSEFTCNWDQGVPGYDSNGVELVADGVSILTDDADSGWCYPIQSGGSGCNGDDWSFNGDVGPWCPSWTAPAVESGDDGVWDICCYPGFDNCDTSDARYDYGEKRWCHKDQYDANGGTCKNANGGYDFWIYGTVYDWCRCDGYSNYFACHTDADWGAPAYGSGMKQECIPMTDTGAPMWEGGQPVDWKVNGGGWDDNGNPDFPITTGGGGAAWDLDAQCSSNGGAGKDVCASAGYINSAVKRGIEGNCPSMGGRKNSDDGTWCIPDGDFCEDVDMWTK